MRKTVCRVVLSALAAVIALCAVLVLNAGASQTNIALGRSWISGGSVKLNGSPTDGDEYTYVDIDWTDDYYGTQTPNDDCWVAVDLGATVEITGVGIVNYPSGGRYYHFEVYGSTDFEDWTLLCSKTDDERADRTFTYEVSASVRYVKEVGTYNSANEGFHFGEIEIYGEPYDLPESEDLYYSPCDGGSSWQVLGIGGCKERNISIPAEYEGKPVTSIGDCAFCDCVRLTSVAIPDSVTSIGGSAFYNCRRLKAAALPASLRSIGWGAFGYCARLTDVFFAGTSGQWAEIAVSGENDALLDAQIHYETAAIPEELLCENVTWSFDEETGVLTIGGTGRMDDYFDHDDRPWNDVAGQVVRVTVGDGITYIGSESFAQMDALTEIVFGKDVRSLGDYMAAHCRSLSSIVFEGPVETVGYGTVDGCWALSSVTVTNQYKEEFIEAARTHSGNELFESESVTYIERSDGVKRGFCLDDDGVRYYIEGEYQTGWVDFRGCKIYFYYSNGTMFKGATKTLDGETYSFFPLPYRDMTLYVGVRAGDGLAFSLNGDGASYSVTGLNENGRRMPVILIPDTYNGLPVTAIGDSAFSGCSGLTSVTIPESVTSIGEDAFRGCTGLSSVTIPDGVTSIGNSAFSHCDGLTNLSFGGALTEIGGYAFYYCYNLSSVTLTGLTKEDFLEIALENYGNDRFADAYVIYTVADDGVKRGFCLDDDGVRYYKEGEYQTGWVDFRGCKVYFYYSNGTMFKGATKTLDGEIYYFTPVEYRDMTLYVGCRDGGGLVFSLDDDEESYYVSGVERSARLTPACRIPAVYEGKPVTAIGQSAFGNCTKMQSVTIPESVTSIDDSAFENCRSLNAVYYAGTEEQWGRISVGSYNDRLYGSVVYYETVAPASAPAEITIGWRFDEQTCTLYIDGSGPMEDYRGTGKIKPWAEVSPRVQRIVVGDGITYIGSESFASMGGLLSEIVYGKDVRALGFDAMAYNSNLTNVVFKGRIVMISQGTVWACSSLASVAVTGQTREEFLEIAAKRSYNGRYADQAVTFIEYIEGAKNGFYLEDVGVRYYVNDVYKTGWVDFADGKLYFYYSNGSMFTGKTKTLDGLEYRFTSYRYDGLTLNLGHIGSAGLSYFLADDGYIVLGRGTCADSEIVIPPVYRDRPVTGINYEAFAYCTDIVSVVIPESVDYVSCDVFDGCPALERITWKRLSGEYSGGTWTFEDGVLTVRGSGAIEDDERPWDCCAGAVFKLVVGDGITAIGKNVFAGMCCLKEAVFGADVSSIGNSALYNAPRLHTVVFCRPIDSIGAYAFYGCGELSFVTLTDQTKRTFLAAARQNYGNDRLADAGVTYTILGEPPAPVPVVINVQPYYGCIENYYGSTYFIVGGTDPSYCSREELTPKNDGNGNMTPPLLYLRVGITDETDGKIYTIPEYFFDNPGAEIYGDGSFLRIAATWYGIPVINGHRYTIELVFYESDGTTVASGVSEKGSFDHGNDAFRQNGQIIPDPVPHNCLVRGTPDYPEEYAPFDTDGDGTIDVGDVAALLDALSGASPSGALPDLNGDGVADVEDVSFILDYLSGIDVLYKKNGFFLEDVGVRYYEEGEYKTGWIDFEGGKIYFYYSNGTMFRGASKTLDGKEYFFEERSVDGVTVNIGYCPEDLAFTLNGDGASYTVTGAGSYAGGRLRIPSEHNGMPVTAIGGSAFRECAFLTDVTIPESVTSIGGGAFWECGGLKTVTLGRGVTSIGAYAFYNDFAIEKTVYGGSLYEWCAISFANASNPCYHGADLYIGGEKLTELTLPDGMTALGASAFEGCASLVRARLPAGLTSIGDYAFSGCRNLACVILPASLNTVGYTAFGLCARLTTVHYAGTEEDWQNVSISSGNERLTIAAIVFSSSGSGEVCSFSHTWRFDEETGTLSIEGEGPLDDYRGTGLARPWEGVLTKTKWIVVGDGITYIGTECFAYTGGPLLGIVFGKDVRMLGMDAMAYNPKLETIVFGGPVISIGQGTVYQSPIASVTVTGQTKDDFLAVAHLKNYNTNYDAAEFTELP